MIKGLDLMVLPLFFASKIGKNTKITFFYGILTEKPNFALIKWITYNINIT